MNPTVHEQSLEALADRLAEQNRRDAQLAATDPRNAKDPR